ncbi:hypothetical protein VQL36_03340 [Chengkuizengella sp. SCS-71B]
MKKILIFFLTVILIMSAFPSIVSVTPDRNVYAGGGPCNHPNCGGIN